MTVRLEPLGAIGGRVVDRDGRPIAGGRVTAVAKPGGDFAIRLPEVVTAPDGRFTAPAPTGADYTLVAEWPDRDGDDQHAFRNDPVAVRPGATTADVEIREKP